MKIHLHPADQAGCGFFRMREPARIANLEGAEALVDSNVKVRVEQNPATGQVRERPADTDADVVVFQRPAKRRSLATIEHHQRAGKAIVVDLDDDFCALPPLHRASVQLSPATDPDTNWGWIRKACAIADLVTVTTPALAERFGAHGRVAVLPNCVPSALLDMPRDSDGYTVGWAGACIDHPGDLEATRGGVTEALQRAPEWHFGHIGPPEMVSERLHLERPFIAFGGQTVMGYHEAIGKFDVGIVPLADSAFNHGKSYLKGIEYAARGVPFVSSAMPEYEYLAEEGLGIATVNRSRNWRNELLGLMQDEERRAELAARGREIVRTEHTYETQGWQWLEAWQRAIDNRKSSRLRRAA